MITYNNQHQSMSLQDGFTTQLREAADYFDRKRVSIMGSGIEEVLSEQTLFNDYVEKLSEGLTADEYNQMDQLLENTRLQILENASMSGITPISSLSMPTVRKMWVKVALKNAIPTEPVKLPKFSISYMEPYLFDSTGKRTRLPEALRDPKNAAAEKTPLTKEPIELPAEEINLIELAGGSVAIGDAIDTLFHIDTVTIEKEDGEEQTLRIAEPLDLKNNVVAEIEAEDGTTDTLFVNVNLQTGIMKAVSMLGKVKEITINGYLSPENNERAESVSFDIHTKDITVPAGAHINAPLGVEFLQDTMAMYNIDGAVEVVDIMSNVVAQKLDHEILNFLDDSFERAGRPFQTTFDVKPPSTFVGLPKEWKEEIKDRIDHLAARMKNHSAFTTGKFVIIGNPIDTHIIPNVGWSFKSNDGERGGVEVEFDLGATSGVANYQIVSSMNVPPGKLRMIFIPSTPKQMTYKYFPYTFNVEKGYIDGNRSLMPSIMMTKRHVIEELLPIAAEIIIENNDGQSVR